MVPALKAGMGWNFAAGSLGAKINDEIIALIRANKISAVVGKTVSFTDLPVAIDAMANRQTIGRTVVIL